MSMWLTVSRSAGYATPVRIPPLLRLAALIGCLAAQPGVAQVAVSGRLTILDRGDRPGQDVGNAVLWLESPTLPAAMPVETRIVTEGKQFVPRIVVVPAGSTVRFPNNDPFNHNVFSLSEQGSFDLGLYGRGEEKGTVLAHPGLVQVYCNVHAQMSAVILVRGNGQWVRPGSDGSFRFSDVPAGDYTLHVWHERAQPVSQPLRVGAAAPAPLALTLDARRWRFVQHTDKTGRAYSDRGRRY